MKKNQNKKLTIDEVEKIINDYPRTYKEGFTSLEVTILALKCKALQSRISDELMGSTVPIIDGQIVYYPWDVTSAIVNALELRSINDIDWD